MRLRRVLRALLVLAVVGSVSPFHQVLAAPTLEPETAGCGDAAQPAATCAAICQPSQSSTLEHAQTPVAACAAAAPFRAEPAPASSAGPIRHQDARAHRAAFLRFHRFLL